MSQTRNASRLGALVAGGAAVLVLGMAAPAQAGAGGANAGCGNYCATPGDPSGNGYGNANEHANANGLPDAGTVGKADDKNPPGQFPDGTDHNNGYECDGNGGVGQQNPAHTGCGPILP